MRLGAVMDEIAQRLRQAPSLAGGRTHAYPPATIAPPAAIVGYPTRGEFDQTYARGRDRWTGVVVIAVGRPTERQTRDLIAKYIDGSGAESVKALLDADGYASCDSVTVTEWETDVYDIGTVPYLTAVFQLDIWGPGKD